MLSATGSRAFLSTRKKSFDVTARRTTRSRCSVFLSDRCVTATRTSQERWRTPKRHESFSSRQCSIEQHVHVCLKVCEVESNDKTWAIIDLKEDCHVLHETILRASRQSDTTGSMNSLDTSLRWHACPCGLLSHGDHRTCKWSSSAVWR